MNKSKKNALLTAVGCALMMTADDYRSILNDIITE